ncbi:MAG: PAS domain-containing protein [Minwuia sp.]|uniref:PAS domain-containing protein n=1 Tax=Minwuia sp. TaxID=2493630 RepID=UPI003A8972D6
MTKRRDFNEDSEHGFGPPPAWMHADILALHRYWLAKIGDAPIPDRADIDPVIEIPKLLANVWLLDVVGEPRRFRYRLMGSNLTRATTRPRIGQYLDEQEGAGDIPETVAALNTCCDRQIPYWRRGHPQLIRDRFLPMLEYVVLPMSVEHSAETRMLLNMTIYHWKD